MDASPLAAMGSGDKCRTPGRGVFREVSKPQKF